LLLGFENLVLSFLSLFEGVNASILFTINLAALLGLYFWVRQKGLKPWRIIALKQIPLLFWLLLPMGVVLLFLALLYPPNNYDSMTYHMARVAHWIQNQSIGHYPTSLKFQNQQVPGAEYLILLLQLFSGNDRLANIPQFISWIILIFSSTYLLRVLGVPGKMRPFIVLIMASAPMAILQATSTQTDLIAAVMTHGIIIAFGHFIFGNYNRVRKGDYLLVGLACGAGFLVKPTTLLVALPFLLYGTTQQLPKAFQNRNNCIKSLVGFGIFTFGFFLLAGPDMMRKFILVGNPFGLGFSVVQPFFSGWTGARFWHVVWSINSQYPDLIPNIGVSVMPDYNPLRLHEDNVGNPVQTLFALIMLVISPIILSIGFWRGKKQTWIYALLPLASWIILMLVIGPTKYIARYHLPIYYLLPFFLVGAVLLWHQKTQARLLLISLVGLFFLLGYGYGIKAVIKNETRPFLLKYVSNPSKLDRERAYYGYPPRKVEHDLVLLGLAKTECKRLGLILRGSSTGYQEDYDYPLTWRAIKKGISVRHVMEASSWPCLLYSPVGAHIESWKNSNIFPLNPQQTIFLVNFNIAKLKKLFPKLKIIQK
jgi:hypothetical protein